MEVDAVVISHLHADHFLDLVPFSYALTYAPRQQPVPVDRWPGTDNPARPQLHVPAGGRDVLRRVVGAWGNEDLIEKAFDLREYDPADMLEVGPLRVRFQPVPHFVADQRGRDDATDGGGALHLRRRLRAVATSCRSSPSGTDLLLIEATLPRPERDGPRGHLTPAEAGEHGRRAGAGASCSRTSPTSSTSEWAREEASKAFGAPVEVAREGAVYTL